MKTTIIPLSNIFLSFIPVAIVFMIFLKWKMNWKDLLYASFRMLIQLIMIGYLLTYIFNQDNSFWTIIILAIMVIISSWIALHSIKKHRKNKFKHSLFALLLGATPVLFLVTTVIIPNKVWYDPSFIIPLAGMVFANAMNTIGIAAERMQMELEKHSYAEAKVKALTASLIPLTNSFLAVGLVSLPGMMTGQILSGVDPLIAVRYQIVVMTMVMGAGGMSAALFLTFDKES